MFTAEWGQGASNQLASSQLANVSSQCDDAVIIVFVDQ